MKSVFHAADVAEIIGRIEKLTPDSRPLWGKMSVGQMLAHLCVTYEMCFEDTHPKPGFLKRFLLKTFIKNAVVGQKPYPKNSPTAPEFVVREEKVFAVEKARLLAFIQKTQQLGESWFLARDSHSFGPLTAPEWNAMFYKHLDHHLGQFGV